MNRKLDIILWAILMIIVLIMLWFVITQPLCICECPYNYDILTLPFNETNPSS